MEVDESGGPPPGPPPPAEVGERVPDAPPAGGPPGSSIPPRRSACGSQTVMGIAEILADVALVELLLESCADQCVRSSALAPALLVLQSVAGALAGWEAETRGDLLLRSDTHLAPTAT